jgi:hypothetical protein
MSSAALLKCRSPHEVRAHSTRNCALTSCGLLQQSSYLRKLSLLKSSSSALMTSTFVFGKRLARSSLKTE